MCALRTALSPCGGRTLAPPAARAADRPQRATCRALPRACQCIEELRGKREELNKSQDRERAFEAMFMLAMQVFANMFGLNMSQFSGGNVAPLFEREVQKLLVNE